jgi:hypothetical protein
MANKKINYDAINFKNKDVDRFSTRFGKQEVVKDPPKKKEPEGQKNPDYLKGENHKEGVGPYSVGAQSASMRDGYGPKKGWSYVEKGGLSTQDSLDINANRPPTIRQFEIVTKGMNEGIKFPGLTPEFKSSLKNYQNLPQKFK